MASIKSELFSIILRLFFKGNLGKELTKGKVNYKWDSPEPPKMFQKKYKIDSMQIDGRNVFTLSPKNHTKNRMVLYLHGGAFVHSFAKQHWVFIGTLIDKLQCKIVAPDYPLAPDHTYEESFSFVELLFKTITEQNNYRDFVLMGDSAGGGFALALAQKLIEDNLSQPAKIILLSPWLDISMSNPEIYEIASKDPFSEVEDLKLAGKTYSGNTDVNNYLLSPINGSLEGLGKIILFTGTHDVLFADAKKLRKLCHSKGIDISYYEYNKMMHCWMLFNFPESRKAIQQLVDEVMVQ